MPKKFPAKTFYLRIEDAKVITEALKVSVTNQKE